jgi:hypothetical protein
MSKIGPSEAEPFWTDFLRSLMRRGLRGVKLVISDAHSGIKAAVAKVRDELVDRARATALVFRMAREERDAWLNWPVRVAALMAAELGVEAHPMQKALEAHVRSHLADLAEVKPEFR